MLFWSSVPCLGRIPREIVWSLARGSYGRTSTCYGLAIRRVMHNLLQSYNDRRKRSGLMRRLWITRVNAASREYDLQYSRLISGLKRSQVDINRHVLYNLAETEPVTFKCLVDEAKRNFHIPPVKDRNISDL